MPEISLAIKTGGQGLYPVSPMTPSTPEDSVYYPSLHLEAVDGLTLPKEGTVTFKYRLDRESTSYPKAGEVRACYDLEILSVVSVSGSKEDDEDEDTSDVLDKLKAALETAGVETT